MVFQEFWHLIKIIYCNDLWLWCITSILDENYNVNSGNLYTTPLNKTNCSTYCIGIYVCVWDVADIITANSFQGNYWTGCTVHPGLLCNTIRITHHEKLSNGVRYESSRTHRSFSWSQSMTMTFNSCFGYVRFSNQETWNPFQWRHIISCWKRNSRKLG